MPNPLEAARQDMQQEAAEKFHGVEGQSAQPVAMLVILVAQFIAVCSWEKHDKKLSISASFQNRSCD